MLDGLDPTSATFRRTPRKLQEVCTSRIRVSSSHVLPVDLLNFNKSSLASGGFSGVFQGTYDGHEVCIRRLGVAHPDSAEKVIEGRVHSRHCQHYEPKRRCDAGSRGRLSIVLRHPLAGVPPASKINPIAIGLLIVKVTIAVMRSARCTGSQLPIMLELEQLGRGMIIDEEICLTAEITFDYYSSCNALVIKDTSLTDRSQALGVEGKTFPGRCRLLCH